MSFPATRMLRYRASSHLREMLSETALRKSDFIYPLFINQTLEEKRALQKMPGIFQQSLSSLIPEVERLSKLGIRSLLLFGIPSKKDPHGSEAYNPQGVIQQSIRLIKKYFPEMIVIADCCLCEYTSGAHCGLLGSNGALHNDSTLDALQKTALSYAESGVDIIAPSGMMDGKVQALRTTLSGYPHISLMSYAVKFASQFYGPFREAAGSEDNYQADRRVHQLAPSQKKEALREAFLDIQEGADFLIVKPGLPYLDILHTLHEKTLLPLVAYQVSGEYSMLINADYLNIPEAFHETFIAFKRAGAKLIISYYADEMCKHL